MQTARRTRGARAMQTAQGQEATDGAEGMGRECVREGSDRHASRLSEGTRGSGGRRWRHGEG